MPDSNIEHSGSLNYPGLYFHCKIQPGFLIIFLLYLVEYLFIELYFFVKSLTILHNKYFYAIILILKFLGGKLQW
jgi:hypothetical protein